MTTKELSSDDYLILEEKWKQSCVELQDLYQKFFLHNEVYDTKDKKATAEAKADHKQLHNQAIAINNTRTELIMAGFKLNWRNEI